MNSIRRNSILSLSVLALAIAAPFGQVSAADWPTRTVTMVVPFPAGSATDTLARIVAEQLQAKLGQSVVVDNRAGANGTIGTASAVRADDGHTLLMATSTTHAANASLYTQLPYDPVADFKPITRVAQIPFVMLVHPSVPASTSQEFVAYAQANPGKMAWGSGSSGSLIPGHALVTANNLDITHAQYRGVQPAVTDALGNTIQLVFADVASATPHIAAGTLRPLAVTSANPHPSMPDVPPLSRVVPDFEMTAWFALYATNSVPDAAIGRVNEAVHAILSDSAVQERLAPVGFEVTLSSPDELSAFAASETQKWAEAVKSAGIPPQ